MRTALSIVALSAAAGLVTIDTAAAQDRISRECRREIVRLCGSERSKIRACLAEHFSELDDKCVAQLRARMGERSTRQPGARPARTAPATDAISETIFYGEDPRQGVDFYAAADHGFRPPLIAFVHGGGWSFGSRVAGTHAKPVHFRQAGYAFASIGYRLLPQAPVEEQARDLAKALSALRAQADRLGFDPDRIVLMGHSAGAHLAALVSLDPSYAGASLDAISGVILLDGAGYDIAANMAAAQGPAANLYKRAFGDDVTRQEALSPISHVGGRDAPNWLVLHVEGRPRSSGQSQALVARLKEAGLAAEAIPVSGTDHRGMNENLGQPGDAATGVVDAFLAKLFG